MLKQLFGSSTDSKQKSHKKFSVYFPESDITVKTSKLLSEGAFAYVYLAKCKKTKKVFALKQITRQ